MNPSHNFLTLSLQQRATVFEQSSVQRGIDLVIVEKDFWVCWLLGVLFAVPELKSHLVFKGGTSLSKVFGVIDRFSEDVDLSVSPTFVGVDPHQLDHGVSRTSRDKAMSDMQRLCGKTCRDTIAPQLETIIRTMLGAPTQTDHWLSYELDAPSHSPILYFHYPTATTTELPYVRRSVKLELGSLTDQQPVGRHPVKPWVAEDFPRVFPDWKCEVIALELSRSFWEKATILHAEYHRPAEQSMPDRYARHYADLACLLAHKDAKAFMADKARAQRVVEWKSRLFARGWAHYELAKHGSFRLVPPHVRHAELERDYIAMRPLFLHEPPAFSEVMEKLTAAEKQINAL